MSRVACVVAAVLPLASLSGPVPAVQTSGLQTVPSAYNPGNARVHIAAGWSSGVAVSDDSPSSHPLLLGISDMVAFPPGASALAVVMPAEGLHLTHLAFDHKIDTYCTKSSPRWDVETTDGSVYAFGCASGIRQVDLPATGWERITFSCSDVGILKGLPGSCPLGSPQTISRLQVVQDEAGSTALDNLNVNWIVMSGAP